MFRTHNKEIIKSLLNKEYRIYIEDMVEPVPKQKWWKYFICC